MYLIYSFIHTMHLVHAPTPVRRTARCNPGTGSTTAYYDLLTVPEVRPLNSAVPYYYVSVLSHNTHLQSPQV